MDNGRIALTTTWVSLFPPLGGQREQASSGCGVAPSWMHLDCRRNNPHDFIKSNGLERACKKSESIFSGSYVFVLFSLQPRRNQHVCCAKSHIWETFVRVIDASCNQVSDVSVVLHWRTVEFLARTKCRCRCLRISYSSAFRLCVFASIISNVSRRTKT